MLIISVNMFVISWSKMYFIPILSPSFRYSIGLRQVWSVSRTQTRLTSVISVNYFRYFQFTTKFFLLYRQKLFLLRLMQGSLLADILYQAVLGSHASYDGVNTFCSWQIMSLDIPYNDNCFDTDIHTRLVVIDGLD